MYELVSVCLWFVDSRFFLVGFSGEAASAAAGDFRFRFYSCKYSTIQTAAQAQQRTHVYSLSFEVWFKLVTLCFLFSLLVVFKDFIQK